MVLWRVQQRRIFPPTFPGTCAMRPRAMWDRKRFMVGRLPSRLEFPPSNPTDAWKEIMTRSACGRTVTTSGAKRWSIASPVIATPPSPPFHSSTKPAAGSSTATNLRPARNPSVDCWRSTGGWENWKKSPKQSPKASIWRAMTCGSVGAPAVTGTASRVWDTTTKSDSM